MYIAVLNKIIEFVPELRTNLKSFYGDYELSVIAAVKEVLPSVSFYGCLFHYVQVNIV